MVVELTAFVTSRLVCSRVDQNQYGQLDGHGRSEDGKTSMVRIFPCQRVDEPGREDRQGGARHGPGQGLLGNDQLHITALQMLTGIGASASRNNLAPIPKKEDRHSFHSLSITIIIIIGLLVIVEALIHIKVSPAN